MCLKHLRIYTNIIKGGSKFFIDSLSVNGGTLKKEWMPSLNFVDTFIVFVHNLRCLRAQAGGRLVSDHGGGRGPGARLLLHRQHPPHAPHRDSRQRALRSHHHRRVRGAGSVGFINNLRLILDPWNTCKVKVMRWISGQVTPTALVRGALSCPQSAFYAVSGLEIP